MAELPRGGRELVGMDRERGEVRLAGLEPTASAFAGLRSIQLSYKRAFDGHDRPHI